MKLTTEQRIRRNELLRQFRGPYRCFEDLSELFALFAIPISARTLSNYACDHDGKRSDVVEPKSE